MNHYSHTRFSAPDLDFCDDLALSHTHNIFDVSVPYSSRSRSHSRPPPPPLSTTTTTTTADDARARRNNSLSSVQPHSRAQAIVIPGATATTATTTQHHHRMAASVGAAPHNWFFPPHSSPSDFSLPTPDFSHDFFPFAIPSQNGGGGGSGGSGGKDLSPLGHSVLPASLPPHHHHHHHHHHPHTVVQSPADKQAAIASEKRRRRRESHNAVERRRRDNINEKISELATLIPECMLDVGLCLFFLSLFLYLTFFFVGNSPNLEDQVLSPISPVDVVPGLKKEDDVPTGPASEVGVVKANKGMILRKSVEYIR